VQKKIIGSAENGKLKKLVTHHAGLRGQNQSCRDPYSPKDQQRFTGERVSHVKKEKLVPISGIRAKPGRRRNQNMRGGGASLHPKGERQGLGPRTPPQGLRKLPTISKIPMQENLKDRPRTLRSKGFGGRAAGADEHIFNQIGRGSVQRMGHGEKD